VASSAAVFKTELTARQPVSFDAGIKLSNTEPQQFAGEMATHVRVLKSQSGGEVKLNLHPAELGRMSISVSTEGNETRVAFVVETSQARQAVETALPRLRDMLENAGLSLSDSDVSEQRDPQADAGERGPGSSREETTSPDSDDVSASTVLSVTIDPDRLVDTYI
jgi:flagellar hook-length control protein FliK